MLKQANFNIRSILVNMPALRVTERDFHSAFDNYILSSVFKHYCLALRLSLQTVKKADYDVLTLGGACGDAAWLIRRHLLGVKHEASLAVGTYVVGKVGKSGSRDNHCWVRAMIKKVPYIIDITATQFSDDQPPVVIEPEVDLPRYHLDEVDPDRRTLHSILNLSKSRLIAVEKKAEKYMNGGGEEL